MAVYSHELSMVLVNNEELIQMCYKSEEAHSRDRDRMMQIVTHINSERTSAHWHEMSQELTAQGNADMRTLTNDRTMAVHEYQSAEGCVAHLRLDLQTLRDEGRAYEFAFKDGVTVMVRPSEEQVMGIAHNKANAYRSGLDVQHASADDRALRK